MLKIINIAALLLFLVSLLSINFLYSNSKVSNIELYSFIAIFSSIATAVSMALIIVQRKIIGISLNYIDISLGLFALWVIVNFFVTNSLAEPKLFQFLVLITCYINLRILLCLCSNKKKIVILMLLSIAMTETIIGISQLLLGSANHRLYIITGNFLNPGPYGGYIAIIGAIAIGVLVMFKKRDQFLYYAAAITLAATLLVLPASMSRTAWLAIIFSTGVALCLRYSIGLLIKKYKIYFITTSSIVLLLGIGAYFFKQGSANGRFLMWQSSVKAILDKPINGVGLGHFAEGYAPAQREFLADNPNWANAAGTPSYAFNEYLEIGIEQGVGGMLIFLVAISFAVNIMIRGDVYDRVIGLGFIAYLIFAFASYPLKLPPLQILFVILLSFSASVARKGWTIKGIYALFFPAIALSISIFCYRQMGEDASNLWRQSRILYTMKLYQDAVEESALLERKLEYNHEFLFEYGNSLVKIGQNERAIEVLTKATRLSIDPMIYNVMGNAYTQMQDYDNAEKCYITAYETVPSRIYPLYLLVKLHGISGDKKRCLYYANKLMTQKDKIPSPAANDMRKEVHKILQNYQQDKL